MIKTKLYTFHYEVLYARLIYILHICVPIIVWVLSDLHWKSGKSQSAASFHKITSKLKIVTEHVEPKQR